MSDVEPDDELRGVWIVFLLVALWLLFGTHSAATGDPTWRWLLNAIGVLS